MPRAVVFIEVAAERLGTKDLRGGVKDLKEVELDVSNVALEVAHDVAPWDIVTSQ